MTEHRLPSGTDPPMPLLPEPYRIAFEDTDSPFIFYYGDPGRAGISPRKISRGDFLLLILKATGIFSRLKMQKGERFLNGFGANSPEDLVFRLAATLSGTTPVTLNWQTDTPERAAYKASVSSARLMLTDGNLDPSLVDAIREVRPDMAFYDTARLRTEPLPRSAFFQEGPEKESVKIVIFTSGTTGDPKGVILTWENFNVNSNALRQLFSGMRKDPMQLVMVNPLHHTNSTALSDWFFREPGAVIHLLPRYTTPYWRILAETSEQAKGSVIAPCVSRHFDFLEELNTKGELPIPGERLEKALSRVSFLMGSAPVGPITVERILRWTGHLPVIRFGSTETCLQVLGTPPELTEDQVVKALEAGWEKKPSPGYYIGRPHEPFTLAAVVKSVVPGEERFMEPCRSGEEGYLVARGRNLMKGYLDDPGATAKVLKNGWYLGFGDICFTLKNDQDGREDFYWLGRESALLIRGGANYSCEQIATELSGFVRSRYGLEEGAFDLAVVGLRIDSEHEDSCCVTMEVSDLPSGVRTEIGRTFIREARGHVSKGSRPDMLRFGKIPRNFKGGVSIKELKREWTDELGLTK